MGLIFCNAVYLVLYIVNNVCHYFATTRAVKSLALCLFVCVPICSHISKATRPNFPKFLPVAMARILLWWHCNMLCTSGFVYDVMFSHNGGG